MSHEVLITKRQSVFIFLQIQAEGGPQHPLPASTSQHRPSEARLCLDLQKINKNALSSGYQDLMGHLILTTSPWSVLTWITLSAYCQLCRNGWIWFMCCLCRPKCIIHLISAQTNQKEIKCTLSKTKLRSYCITHKLWLLCEVSM